MFIGINYGFKNKNKQTKKTWNEWTWIIVDHEVSEDSIFLIYLREAWKGWDNIFQGSATGLGGTSGLKHREPKTQNKREGRLHSEAPISLACLLHI